MVLHEHEDEARAGDEPGEEFGDLAQTLRADWDSFRRSIRRVALVEARRVQMRAVDATLTLLLSVLGVLAILAATIASSIFLIIGLRDLLRRWAGAGVPEVVTCIVGVSLGIVAMLIWRHSLRVRMVRATQRRLARLEDNARSEAAPVAHAP